MSGRGRYSGGRDWRGTASVNVTCQKCLKKGARPALPQTRRIAIDKGAPRPALLCAWQEARRVAAGLGGGFDSHRLRRPVPAQRGAAAVALRAVAGGEGGAPAFRGGVQRAAASDAALCPGHSHPMGTGTRGWPGGAGALTRPPAAAATTRRQRPPPFAAPRSTFGMPLMPFSPAALGFEYALDMAARHTPCAAGHYTYECQSQPAAYKPRPSRTALLKNPGRRKAVRHCACAQHAACSGAAPRRATRALGTRASARHGFAAGQRLWLWRPLQIDPSAACACNRGDVRMRNNS